MVIARMPFQSLFKAGALSRSWYFKFPLPSSSVRSSSLSLQEHIALVSSRWPTYCPVYVSKDKILGFDRGSHRWRSMLTLSYLPVPPASSLTCCGSLICIISEFHFGYDVFVTNVITKRWRKLPHCLHVEDPDCIWICQGPDHLRVLPLGIDGYRVLLVHRSVFNNHGVDTHIYNSELKTWTVKESKVHLDTFFGNSAYLDEKLYCMCQNRIGDPLQLWMYDVAENCWTAIPHSVTAAGAIDAAVLRCGDKVMMAIWFATDPIGRDAERLFNLYTPKDSISIYELATGSLRLEHVGTGPPTIIWGVGLHRGEIYFASDADFLYFGQSIPSCPVMSFNVYTYEWSCLPPASYSCMDKKFWENIAFEPGLNPFTVV